MNEMSNQKSAAFSQRKRRGTNLDRSFPAGTILLIILGVVVFLQVISAWKIMNIERERATLEAEKKNYAAITQLLPKLQREIGEKESKHLELKGVVADLESKRIQSTEELREITQRANELISKNELDEIRLKDQERRVLKLKSAVVAELDKKNKLTEEVNFLKSEKVNYELEKNRLEERVAELKVELKHLEFDKLAIANSDIKKVIDSLKTRSKEFKQSQNEAKKQLANAAKELNRATSKITESVSKIEQEASNVETSTGVVVKKIQGSVDGFLDIKKKLDISAEELRKSLVIASKEIASLKQRQQEIEEMLKVLKELHQQMANSAEILNSADLKETLENLKENTKNAIDKIQGLQDATRKLQNELSKIKKIKEFKQEPKE